MLIHSLGIQRGCIAWHPTIAISQFGVDAIFMKKTRPVSPGEMLQKEFLKPLGLTPYRLAKDIDVPATRVYAIVSGKRAVTAETDLLLCRYFGFSDGWWLAVQSHHDTQAARQKLGKRLELILRCSLLDAAIE